jgi:hypothetical protein
MVVNGLGMLGSPGKSPSMCTVNGSLIFHKSSPSNTNKKTMCIYYTEIF